MQNRKVTNELSSVVQGTGQERRLWTRERETRPTPKASSDERGCARARSLCRALSPSPLPVRILHPVVTVTRIRDRFCSPIGAQPLLLASRLADSAPHEFPRRSVPQGTHPPRGTHIARHEPLSIFYTRERYVRRHARARAPAHTPTCTHAVHGFCAALRQSSIPHEHTCCVPWCASRDRSGRFHTPALSYGRMTVEQELAATRAETRYLCCPVRRKPTNQGSLYTRRFSTRYYMDSKSRSLLASTSLRAKHGDACRPISPLAAMRIPAICMSLRRPDFYQHK